MSLTEDEAKQFIQDITHAMRCSAHQGEGHLYSDDFGEKILEIREQVLENVRR